MKKLLYFLTIIFAAAILYFSIYETSTELAKFNLFGCLLHIIAYAILAASAYLALTKRTSKQLCWLAVLVTLYGAALELTQAFLPGRVPSLVDVTANGVGVLLAIGFLESFK